MKNSFIYRIYSVTVLRGPSSPFLAYFLVMGKGGLRCMY